MEPSPNVELDFGEDSDNESRTSASHGTFSRASSVSSGSSLDPNRNRLQLGPIIVASSNNQFEFESPLNVTLLITQPLNEGIDAVQSAPTIATLEDRQNYYQAG
jgi:hypothetical protein